MGITKEQANRCVTHSYACDCREYKYQKMEHALETLWVWASISGLLAKDQVLALCEEALMKNEDLDLFPR